jgi:hypothetical protein
MVVRSVGLQIATSVHRLQPHFTDRNMMLQNFTVGRYTESNLRSPKATRVAILDSSRPMIRQSRPAVSGKASSSFTSVGGSLWRRSSSALHKQMPNFRPVLDRRLSTMPSSPRSLQVPSRRRCAGCGSGGAELVRGSRVCTPSSKPTAREVVHARNCQIELLELEVETLPVQLHSVLRMELTEVSSLSVASVSGCSGPSTRPALQVEQLPLDLLRLRVLALATEGLGAT